MQTLNFDVTGMTCGGCTGSVQRVLSKLDGVSHAEVTLQPGIATVVFDPDRVTVGPFQPTLPSAPWRDSQARRSPIRLGELSRGRDQTPR